MGETRHDVNRAKRHDQRAQQQLRPLPVREPERAAAIERPQGQEEVGEQGAVENGLAQRIVPDEDEPCSAGFEHAQRDQAERMVEQMRDDIEEEDVGRPEASRRPWRYFTSANAASGGRPIAARLPATTMGRCNRTG